MEERESGACVLELLVGMEEKYFVYPGLFQLNDMVYRYEALGLPLHPLLHWNSFLFTKLFSFNESTKSYKC
jgi:hypothetical protein